MSKSLTTIAWKLIYQDIFDRECPPSVDKEGKGFLSGLYYLWQYTLSEGITNDGKRSFSDFSIVYDNWEYLGIEYSVDFNGNYIKLWDREKELAKLRNYIYGNNKTIEDREKYIMDGEKILKGISEYHYNLLIKRKTDNNMKTILETSNEILDLLTRVNLKKELLALLL